MAGVSEATIRTLIPENLAERFRNTPQRRAWLSELPGTVASAVDHWRLTLDLPTGGSAWSGHTALALPVRQENGRDAVLKASFPEPETAEEAAALQLWGGQGAVPLIDQDPLRRVLLLDRLNDSLSLAELPMHQAVSAWGSVLRNLSRNAAQRSQWQLIPRLLERAERWAASFEQEWRQLRKQPGVPGASDFPFWLLKAAVDACQTELKTLPQAEHVLVHADLHYENILAIPGRSGQAVEDFLAIDPQAVVGVPEFAVAPALWNRLRDLPADSPEEGLLDRFESLCAAAGLDESSARRWSIVREVDNALWYAAAPGHERDLGRSLWVASTLAGTPIPELAHPHLLDISLGQTSVEEDLPRYPSSASGSGQ
ncbi:aminoglycoside phosphotransferase family protein [Acaricomes phytoseiuli]|uniref:aminoglycoside phosphotransferase family protein n=1 Tax=Acaricomes phytoseiuli TaxID=291968 RepID=UPI00035F9B49|nr:aminoglycoside phosphotransferase family protein [Acaricomes phytoseiuli]